MRIFGNFLFHAGRDALPEVFRQTVQGIKSFRGIRPHIHVHRIHRNDGHQDFFAVHAVYLVIPDFFIISIPVGIKRDMGVAIFYLMSHEARPGHMLEVIGTSHYRHAAKQHERHQGSEEQEPVFLHKQAIS